MDYKALDNVVRNTKTIFLEEAAFNVEEKSRSNYVTNVDKKIENYLVQKLKEIVPDATFVLEESKKNFSNKYFVIDPLDGTYNFIRGIKIYGVSVALVDNNQLMYGSLYDPNSDTLISSYEDKVYLNNEEYLPGLNKRTISTSFVDLGTSPYVKAEANNIAALLSKLLVKAIDVRRSGSTVINLMNLALGKIDGFIEPNLSIWDYLGGVKILKTLGLYSSNFQGDEISLSKMNENFIGAANKDIGKELLKIIGEVYG